MWSGQSNLWGSIIARRATDIARFGDIVPQRFRLRVGWVARGFFSRHLLQSLILLGQKRRLKWQLEHANQRTGTLGEIQMSAERFQPYGIKEQVCRGEIVQGEILLNGGAAKSSRSWWSISILQLDVSQRHLLYIRAIFKQEHTGRPSGGANATDLNNNRHITKVQGQSIKQFPDVLTNKISPFPVASR